MLPDVSRTFQKAGLLLTGLGVVIGIAVAQLDGEAEPELGEAAHDVSSVTQKKPLSVATFKAHVDQYSHNNMMVVLLRRNDCAICPAVRDGLDEARTRLQRKIERGFAVYELNADQNPEVAALLRQRDPAVPARLHVFYNGEKIYESHGISENARDLSEVLEMVQALADGEVSVYDKYQPSRLFDAPDSGALSGLNSGSNSGLNSGSNSGLNSGPFVPAP